MIGTDRIGLPVSFLEIDAQRILNQDWMLVHFAESISVERNTLGRGIYLKFTGLDAQRAPELGLMAANNFIRAFGLQFCELSWVSRNSDSAESRVLETQAMNRKSGFTWVF